MIGSESIGTEVWKVKFQDLKDEKYNDKMITILPGSYVPDKSLPFTGTFPPKKPTTGTVKEISMMLYKFYNEKLKALFDSIDVNKEAIKNLEQEGIVFIDEIDKLAIPEGMSINSKGVSTQGVQRDLLPLLEGTVINTKYGDVRTDHILFIASGAFSQTKPTDLIPELLGRLPIRVDLKPITLSQFVRILKEPEFNLLMQQTHLLKREDVDLSFNEEAISEIAKTAYQINLNTQNTGARRLHSLIEKVMEDYSFNAPDLHGTSVVITKEYVADKLKGMADKIQLTKFLI